MDESKIRILYVDDEVNNLISFKANFRTLYEVFAAESAEEGMQILKEQEIHIIITDQRMPHITGIQFLESAIKEHPDPIRILLTGYADIEAVIDAINKGQIYHYVVKPFNIEDLKVTIEDAYNVYLFKKHNKGLLDKYKKIFEESSDAIFVVDHNGKLIDFNKASIDLLNYSRHQLSNIAYQYLIEDEKGLDTIINELKNKKIVENFEMKLTDSVGNKVDCLVSITPVNNDNGNVVYYGMIKNITKQKKVNNEFIRTIINSQEKERDEFSVDLHDNISQQLASINFYIQTLQNFKDLPEKTTSEKLLETNTLLNNVLDEIRELCYKIMPRTLVGFSFADSIRDFCRRIELKERLTFNIDIDKSFPDVDKSMVITLFRVIQEFIDNSVKHSRANCITIKAEYVDKEIIVLLQDNGLGFSVKNFLDLNSAGLKNMKSRIESYNGEMRLDSSHEGTSCKIIIPFQK
jgi:PAS domain S-box-containing protein